MKNFVLGVLFLSACILSPLAFANGDSIEVHASSFGHPPPGSGMDSIEINLNRPYDREQFKDSALEKLFVEVERILKKREIENEWGWLVVDAPRVSITIKLNGRKFSLASSHPYLGEQTISKIERESKGKQAFDEVYAAIRRYVNTKMLVQQK